MLGVAQHTAGQTSGDQTQGRVNLSFLRSRRALRLATTASMSSALAPGCTGASVAVLAMLVAPAILATAASATHYQRTLVPTTSPTLAPVASCAYQPNREGYLATGCSCQLGSNSDQAHLCASGCCQNAVCTDNNSCLVSVVIMVVIISICVCGSCVGAFFFYHCLRDPNSNRVVHAIDAGPTPVPPPYNPAWPSTATVQAFGPQPPAFADTDPLAPASPRASAASIATPTRPPRTSTTTVFA